MKKLNMINDLKLDLWFPTVIGICDYKNYSEKKDKWINYISEKQTKEGFGKSYQPHKDNLIFDELNKWITFNVNEYANLHKFAYNYEAKESWFLNYEKNQYNPWHTHSGYTISVVFFLSGNSNQVKIQFRNPVKDMINPQNKKIENDITDTNLYNEFTYHSCNYDTVPGRLLIFRSHTEHCTTQNILGDKRIVFSYNYNPKN
jgi:hypothetical protein